MTGIRVFAPLMVVISIVAFSTAIAATPSGAVLDPNVPAAAFLTPETRASVMTSVNQNIIRNSNMTSLGTLNVRMDQVTHGAFQANASAARKATQNQSVIQALNVLFTGTTSGASGTINESEYMALVDTVTGYAGTATAVTGNVAIQSNSSAIGSHQTQNRRMVSAQAASMASAPVSGAVGYGSLSSPNVAGFANRIWATPFHVNQKQDSKDNLAGWEYKTTGITLGYDHYFGPLNLGAAVTYSRGDYSSLEVADDNKIDNIGGSIYGQYFSGSGFFANFDGGFNHGKNDWNRYLGNTMNDWERGKNYTNSYWIGGALGYNLNFGCTNTVSLSPSVGLYWYESKSSAYNSTTDRTPAQVFMGYGKMTQKSLLLPVQVEAEYNVKINECSNVSLRATGGYTYNFKDNGAEGTAYIGGVDAGFGNPVTGMKSARHGWKAGAGVTYRYKQLEVGVDYQYEGAKKYQSHGVSATIGVRF